jgi:hypothetical protein
VSFDEFPLGIDGIDAPSRLEEGSENDVSVLGAIGGCAGNGKAFSSKKRIDSIHGCIPSLVSVLSKTALIHTTDDVSD